MSGIIFVASAVAYAILALVLLFQPGYRRGMARWVLLFLLAATAWQLSYWVGPPSWRARLPAYGVLLQAVTFFYLTLAFLHHEALSRRWWLLAAGGLVGALALDGVLFLVRPGAAAHPLWRLAMLAGWAVLTATTIRYVVQAYKETGRRPLHRNRLHYWLITLILLAAGHIFAFAGRPLQASILLTPAIALAAYAALTYRLLDVRDILRRLTSYVLSVLLVGGLFVLLAEGIVLVAPGLPYRATIVGAGLTMMLVLLFGPLQRGMHQLVSRFSEELNYDPNRTLRDYSMIISSIVDLSQLEATVVSLISEAMEISYGTLFLLDTGEDVVGRPVRQLVSVHGFGQERLVLGSFAANSPVADFLSNEHRPLTQYDIDMLPRFHALTEPEKQWLSGLGVEVFVPIYDKGHWVGLLGLGPKMSGYRYFKRDLTLLSTLADQTAVALENARLVADLVRLNRELKEAYGDLERANRRLQENDRLKSEFIGVITHEMRTPFAGMSFSLQLLQQEGVKNLTAAQRQELAQLKRSINAARDMVDNLVKFASFLNKQGELQLTRFDFCDLMQEAALPLRRLAENKGVGFTIFGLDLPIPVRGDRPRLADAIHHLLHNAVKFTEPGGRVRLRARREGAQIRFEVQDTGCGVPQDRLASLWNGFVQLADPLQRGVEGVGLGLALVQYIVQAHGGDVFAYSKENAGSTFGFTIPAGVPPAATSAAPAMTPSVPEPVPA